jgi:predicted nucleic acid-binding protein
MSSVSSAQVKSVVADSNVLLAAVARRAAWRVFEGAPNLVIATTEVAIEEMHEHVGEFAGRYDLDVDVLHTAIEVLPVERYGETDYLFHVKEARRLIEQRDPDDVHIVALALKLGVPIWSNDGDFRDLPIEVYTTARLLKVLGV